MFGKFMNNYYYGKSGKGDYTPEDLPKTRMQLFWEMLRTRLSALCRLNMLYAIPWLPALIVISILVVTTLTIGTPVPTDAVNADGTAVVETAPAVETEMTEEELIGYASQLQSVTMMSLILLVPCIAITGPWTAGMSYVTRNWARDEHAFIWSDFKDAMKENWKPALVLSAITGAMPLVVYLGWTFYGEMSLTQPLMVIPQVLTLMVGIIWSLAITYAYPMLVTYKMNLRTVLRNSMLIAVGRLPMSVGIRLLHCVPCVLLGVLTFVFGNMIVPLLLFVYYVFFGFSLSRFITASYTNATFDKYINSRIEGAQVNRGLSEEEDDEDWEEEEERELKPWENGYTDR